MTRVSRIAFAFATLWAALAANGGFAQTHGRRALLIGINAYPGLPDKYQLHGCLNDVRDMQKLLTGTFGFKDGEIVTLLDAQASRAGILAALDDLAKTTAPGDLVVIYYSGHGSQAPDMDGDEEDHLDETLVPSDIRTGAPEEVAARQVLDDDVGAAIEHLAGRKVLVAFDSCHSGTMTRDLTDRQSRGITLQEITGSGSRDALSGALVTRAPQPVEWREMKGRVVFLSASLDVQTSNEKMVGTERRGVFTVSLVKALRDAVKNSAAWDDVLTISRTGVTRLLGGPEEQTPTLAVYPGVSERKVVEFMQPDRDGAQGLAHTSDSHPTFKVTLATATGATAFKEGELVSFNVTSEKAGFLYVIDMQTVQGKTETTLLFPTKPNTATITAGDVRKLPTDGAIRVDCPCGEERVYAVVLPAPWKELEALAQKFAGSGKWEDLVFTEKDLSNYLSAVRLLFGGRVLHPMKTDSDAWAMSTLAIRTMPR